MSQDWREEAKHRRVRFVLLVVIPFPVSLIGRALSCRNAAGTHNETSYENRPSDGCPLAVFEYHRTGTKNPPPKTDFAQVIGVPRVSPEPAADPLPAVFCVHFEHKLLIVADRFDDKTKKDQDPGNIVDGSEVGGRNCVTARLEQGARSPISVSDRGQNRRGERDHPNRDRLRTCKGWKCVRREYLDQ
jgi:hypothetical protein